MLERFVDGVLRGDDRGRLGELLAEDLGFDEPGEPDGELVADELLGGDLEDLCECVLECAFGGHGVRWYVRSISSSVNCLVSRTKQKIMNQAMRLSPA